MALLLVLAAMSASIFAQPGISSAMRCVEFATTDPLKAGQSFTARVGDDLEFRLKAGDLDGVWLILLGPKNSPLDYVWIASPPFRTAPHTQIGSGYGLTAAQSARMTPRRLRFVRSDAAYNRGLAMYESARRDAPLPFKASDFEALGDGTLEVSITSFDLAGEELAWVRVKGRACVPR